MDSQALRIPGLGDRPLITFEQIKSNLARLGFDYKKEQKALDRLLVRKVKDKDTGLNMPVTIVTDQGFVPAGIVPWMIDELKDYRIDDKMWAKDETVFEVDESCFIGREPRAYQIKASKMMLSEDRGICAAPTGSGKTAIMSAMAHSILRAQPEWRIMVVCFTGSHTKQIVDDLREFGHKVQILGKGNPTCPVVVARFDAFERHTSKAGPWNDWIRSCEVVYYDEVRHLGSANTYINFAQAIDVIKSYGFDATPVRDFETWNPYNLIEDMQTVGYCGPIRVLIPLHHLQKMGYLPLTYVHMVPMPRPPAMRRGGPKNLMISMDYNVIYKHFIVLNDFRTERFARLITNLAGCGKILCLIKQHEHARRLMQFLQEQDVESLAWFGADKALAVSPLRGVHEASFGTQEVRRRFMETDLPVVIGSSVLSEAISLDVVTDAVNLAAGNTFSLSSQRAGRTMRRNQGLTPVVHYWDSDDHCHKILQAQSRKRREHYRAFGLNVLDVPCPEVCTIDFRKYGLTHGRMVWP
ncbi:hypothetical protein LCGC14_0332090 [marine sediment metagenome]|uniref:Helicase ATP-binding domain-containing protein n=1 Tax=marine sediment metagenome TaxID=412755 RepID=A0A0F9TG42_9ZZZZ